MTLDRERLRQELDQRLAEKVAAADRRKTSRAHQRAHLAQARNAGLKQRHQRKAAHQRR